MIRKLIFSKRLNGIKLKEFLYSNTHGEDIYNFQLKAFNDQWSLLKNNHPFYKYWSKVHSLPKKINNLEEILTFPTLTKSVIQDHNELIFGHLKNYKIVSTGGSTGEPTKFPIMQFENTNNYCNTYLGRGWSDIYPFDNILLFWGHSHLFGSGIRGVLKQKIRYLSDIFINTKRVSAYNVSTSTLHENYKIIFMSNPAMIIGYTSVIFKIAKFIIENDLDIGKKNNLKTIVVTSENVNPVDIKTIEEAFKVPCVIEYGMVETGVIAYSNLESKKLKFFWDSHIGFKSKNNTLLLTTISKKLFPLINYNTGDLIESNNQKSIIDMIRVIGRENDFLSVKVGSSFIEVHSEIFTHIIKSIPKILSFQIIQKKDNKIKVEYVSKSELKIKSNFNDEIKKEFKDISLSQFSFKRVPNIAKTKAGKQKWITKENKY